MDGPLLPRLDAEANALLRRSLRALAETSDDPEVRRLVTDALTGRRDLREIVHAAPMRDALDAGIARCRAEWESLTPTERAQLAAQSSAPILDRDT